MKFYRWVWLQHFTFIIILAGVMKPRVPEVSIPLTHDESYHLTDELVDATYDKFNILSRDQYYFMGHPPGYPLTLKVFFDSFGATSSTARWHSLLFSFMTLFVFYLLCREYVAFSAAVLITLSFYYSYTFFNTVPRVVGDMSALFFILVTIKMLFIKYYKVAALTAFACVVFRESGSALPVAVALAFFLLSREKKDISLPSLSELALIMVPALGFLCIFFAANYYHFNHFSRHPYVLGHLIHIDPEFFAWSSYKWGGLRMIRGHVFMNLGFLGLIVLFLGVASLLLPKFNSRFKRLPMLSFFFVAAFFLAFFILYGDIIGRDLLPLWAFFYFFLSFFIGYFTPKVQVIVAVVLMLFSFKNLRKIDFASEAEHISLVVNYAEQNFPGEKVYFGWPTMELIDEIHGYFKGKSVVPTPYDDSSVEVIALNSRMSNFLRDNVQNAISSSDMVFVERIKFKGVIYRFYSNLSGKSIKDLRPTP